MIKLLTLLKRKNKKKVLYSYYKEQLKNNTSDNSEQSNEPIVPIQRKKRITEGQVKKSDEVSVKGINRSIVIEVESFESGIGCSHICKVIKNYILSKGKSVTVVQDFKDIITSYNTSQFIIYDKGNRKEKKANFYDIKIVVCLLEDTYLRKLKDNLNVEYRYFFNHVPFNKTSKVSELMEDYKYFCFPVCFPDTLDKTVGKELKQILKL